MAAHLRRPSAPRGHIQSSSHPRAEDMARLVERTDRADKIRQRKDSRFYAWRFGSPLSCYQFCYRQENGLEGFLVLNTRLAVGPVHLVDWAASTYMRFRPSMRRNAPNVGINTRGGRAFPTSLVLRRIVIETLPCGKSAIQVAPGVPATRRDATP